MLVLQQALSGEIEIAISPAILGETFRVLREKFGWSKEDLDAGRDLILTCTRLIEPKQALDIIKDDPTDNRILECAVEVGAEFILSGDRHLLRLGDHGGIRIMRVSDFLAR